MKMLSGGRDVGWMKAPEGCIVRGAGVLPFTKQGVTVRGSQVMGFLPIGELVT